MSDLSFEAEKSQILATFDRAMDQALDNPGGDVGYDAWVGFHVLADQVRSVEERYGGHRILEVVNLIWEQRDESLIRMWICVLLQQYRALEVDKEERMDGIPFEYDGSQWRVVAVD